MKQILLILSGTLLFLGMKAQENLPSKIRTRDNAPAQGPRVTIGKPNSKDYASDIIGVWKLTKSVNQYGGKKKTTYHSDGIYTFYSNGTLTYEGTNNKLNKKEIRTGKYVVNGNEIIIYGMPGAETEISEITSLSSTSLVIYSIIDEDEGELDECWDYFTRIR